MISTKDKKRIEEAEFLHNIYWGKISAWSDEADSEEAKEILKGICNRKYHEEEAFAGCL